MWSKNGLYGKAISYVVRAFLLSYCNLFHRFGLEVDDVAINVIQSAQKNWTREKLEPNPGFWQIVRQRDTVLVF